MATGSSGRRRRYDFLPAKTEVPVKKPKAEWLKVMAIQARQRGRPCAVPKLRQQTVEPVFGSHHGGPRLHRILAARPRQSWPVSGDLVALSYNCKRLHKLKLERAS